MIECQKVLEGYLTKRLGGICDLEGNLWWGGRGGIYRYGVLDKIRSMT